MYMRSCPFGTIDYPSWEERRMELLLENDGDDKSQLFREGAQNYIHEISRMNNEDDCWFDYSVLREFALEFHDDAKILLAIQSTVIKQHGGDNPCVAQDASFRLQDNEDFMRKILDMDTYAEVVANCSDRLLDDETFITQLITKNGNYLEYVSPRLRNDPRMVMVAAKTDFKTLRFAPSDILSNKEFMFQVAVEVEVPFEVQVQDYDDPIQFASDELLDDQEFMINLIKEKGGGVDYLKYVSPRLKRDPQTVLAALKDNIRSLRFVPKDIRENKEFIMRAVEIDSRCLLYTNKELRDDEEVIMHSIRNSPQHNRTLIHASPRLRGNRQLVKEAVQKVGRDLKYASPGLRNDFDVVLTAARGGLGTYCDYQEDYRKVYEYASETLQKNMDILVSSKLRNLLLPQTDVLLDQQRTPTSLFPDLFERAKDNPIVLYYILKNRQDLIPSNTDSVPLSSNNKKRKRNS